MPLDETRSSEGESFKSQSRDESWWLGGVALREGLKVRSRSVRQVPSDVGGPRQAPAGRRNGRARNKSFMYWFQKRDESDRWMKQADRRSNKGDENYVDEKKGDTREEERVCLVKRRALLWPYKYDGRPR